VELLGVAAEGALKQPYVVLREKGGQGVVEIFIGPAEAQAITMALNQQVPPRPLTHDLMISILRGLNVRLKEVLIHDLRENTYYAWLHLETGDGHELSLDSRPSDAIALALRAGTPILVHARLFRQPASEVNPSEQGGSSREEHACQNDASRRSKYPVRALKSWLVPPR